MRMATAEIDELKDDLRHAEQMLAKSLHDKDAAQALLANRGRTLDNLNAQLQQRDQESLKKDQMFRSLEQ